jgi:hypothetical protein
MAHKPDEPGEFAFCVFNIIYGIACIAVMIWVPSPVSWLPWVAWPSLVLFMAINVAGLFWSW